MLRREPKPSRYYFQQWEYADLFRHGFEKQMLASGWVWEGTLRQWTHPKMPGTVISY